MIQPMVRMCKCGRAASQRHHKFPQHKAHRELYGKLLDKPFNIEWMCANCHSSHSNIDPLWDEEDFLKALIKYVDELERYREVFK